MGDPNQRIIVVSNHALFASGKDYFEGFMPAEKLDYEARILLNFEVMRRGSLDESPNHPEGNAEKNLSFKQPIGYTVIFNPHFGKVFAYQRSSKGGESRLHGKWSWGFGGHIEPVDGTGGNMLRESILREVTREEVSIKGKTIDLRNLGYINNDANPVSRVHFGMLYCLATDALEVQPKDPEIERVELLSFGELEEKCSSAETDVEVWSKIALEPLRKLL